MRRWLLRWLIGGEDVYIAVYEADGSPVVVHTDFDGADFDLAGKGQGHVVTATMVID
jgi:hypothetical protein